MDSDGVFSICVYNENTGEMTRRVSLETYDAETMKDVKNYKLKVYEDENISRLISRHYLLFFFFKYIFLYFMILATINIIPIIINIIPQSLFIF